MRSITMASRLITDERLLRPDPPAPAPKFFCAVVSFMHEAAVGLAGTTVPAYFKAAPIFDFILRRRVTSLARLIIIARLRGRGRAGNALISASGGGT